jgi:hypothetical protein
MIKEKLSASLRLTNFTRYVNGNGDLKVRVVMKQSALLSIGQLNSPGENFCSRTLLWTRGCHLINYQDTSKNVFFRDGGVSSVLKSSFTPCKLRFSARYFLALTKNSKFLEVPISDGLSEKTFELSR